MSSLRSPLCFVRALWRSLRSWLATGFTTSGHDFVEEETIHGATVFTARCECCGAWSVSWKRGAA